MATQRRPRSRSEERRDREDRRRSDEVVVPPPPEPPPPRPLLRRRSDGSLAVAVGTTAGAGTFVGGSAAAMFGVASAGEGGAALVDNTVKAVGKTLARVAALRIARQRLALEKAGFEPSRIEVALARERELEAIYQRRARERIRAALNLATTGRDASARTAATESAFRREKNYARQRALASGARVFASISQQALEEQSPLGAFWRLGIAKDHTPDCVAMAGKFWPWEVLRRIHPLLHVGCQCALYSYGEAIAAGWMTPAAVMDLETARRLASPVIDWVERQHAQENEALAELLLRRELARIPGADLDFLAAAPLRADAIAEDEEDEEDEEPPEPDDD